MKCKICKTGRDDLVGDICVDCLADELAKIFGRRSHGNDTINNPIVCPDPMVSVHHTTQDLTAEVAGLKADLAKLKSDVAKLKSDVAKLKSDVARLKMRARL
jgi:ubiquinone biosynthesis protein UbiJ